VMRTAWAAALVGGLLVVEVAAWGMPWAAEVVEYVPGAGVRAGYDDPDAAIGEPSRFTPDPEFGFDSVVSVFSPPYRPEQVVSLGDGGALTVRLGEPAVDDPLHPFGVDLIVFGNAGFVLDFEAGAVASPAALLGEGAGHVAVSPDGVRFFEIPGVRADSLFPTQGYLDSGMFDSQPGQVPADFRRPVNPALTLQDFAGLSYEQVLGLYDGSGGGLPIDIAEAVDELGRPAGLQEVRYVRVWHVGEGHTEIDGFAVVPEPAGLGMFVGALAVVARLGRRRGGR